MIFPPKYTVYCTEAYLNIIYWNRIIKSTQIWCKVIVFPLVIFGKINITTSSVCLIELFCLFNLNTSFRERYHFLNITAQKLIIISSMLKYHQPPKLSELKPLVLGMLTSSTWASRSQSQKSPDNNQKALTLRIQALNRYFGTYVTEFLILFLFQ